jgi:uncharacterized membrane protein YfcA
MFLTLFLGLAALCTALLSGVFGMAGGMLLIGVYAAVLPVPTAMVLHGATQLIANSSRALILRRDVYWRGTLAYVLGAGAAFALSFSVSYVPEPLAIYLGLGLTPFLVTRLPALLRNFEDPRVAAATGFQVMAVQLLAGAAGPLLDTAFLDTRLTRTQIVATKAMTQVLSHALKVAYFVPALGSGAITPELASAVLLATIVGTRVGTLLLTRLSEQAFRRCSRAIVYAIGSVYLCKAGLLVWH